MRGDTLRRSHRNLLGALTLGGGVLQFKILSIDGLDAKRLFKSKYYELAACHVLEVIHEDRVKRAAPQQFPSA